METRPDQKISPTSTYPISTLVNKHIASLPVLLEACPIYALVMGMAHFSVQSPAQQLAAHLREQLGSAVWTGTMPGTIKLASDLGLDRRVVIEALKLLERDGLLESQGNGLPRKIVSAKSPGDAAPLRIMMLLYDSMDTQDYYITDMVHQLQAVGHHAAYAPKTMGALGMDIGRIARMVEKTEADAWIIRSGPQKVIEWFANQEVPSFALFGRHMEFPIASVNAERISVIRQIVNRLHKLGHRRMVMMVREERRKPQPGANEREFLSTLEQLGIQTGTYNMPDWGNDAEGLHQCIDSLFKHTPPTALIFGEPNLFLATRQHLADQGIIAPRDVSMVSMDPNPSFDWFQTSISHITWDSKPWINRVVKWADNVALGKEDLKKTLTKAEFIEGSTIGPPPSKA